MHSVTAAGASSHLTGLQSLRGLAAIIVLFHHALFYFATTASFRFWSEALFNAHAAVMLFFVLSGFVLVRSINRQQPTVASTAVFYGRRIFRIVPAMWVAILVAAVYFASLRYLPAGPLTSTWYTTNVRIADTGPVDFVKALFGLPSRGVLPPLWSIRVEIGASVVIPVFAALAARGRMTIAFAALALCLGTILASTWYVGAASYIALFIFGATLVPYFDCFRGGRWGRALALAALGVLLFFRLVNPLWRFETDFSAVVPGLVEGCAAAILIGVVGAQPLALGVLTRPLSRVSGRYLLQRVSAAFCVCGRQLPRSWES